MAVEHYDAIVIGAGHGADPLSRALAGAGRKTALIERGQVGGTCTNRGCTPTKTMLASAHVAHLARRAHEYGVRTGPVEVDVAAVRRRRDNIVRRFRHESRRQLEATNGLDLIFGEARFTGPKTLSVRQRANGEELSLTADRIVIDTGTRPAAPPIEGLREIPYLDSTSILEMDDALPPHLIILGGGYIGLEFAQMFRRFGSRVTIVEQGDRLLPGEDEDVAAAVADILREDGVDVRLRAEAVRAQSSGGEVALTVRGDASPPMLAGSHLLVATGRVPNTDGLGLETAGVETDDAGYVRVDERLATSAPGVWAMGDVTGGPAFTHVSYDDFRILSRNLLGGENATTEGRIIPYTVFIDPQLGRVGMTEREARADGRRIRVAKLPMTEAARTVETGETRGFLKAVVEEDTGRILGCALLCREGGEIMSVVQMAMRGGLSYTDVRDTILAHPTLSEALINLFLQLEA
uniref:PF00070 family, FAD-dependent NAD(P)-disulphide oxidoreductase n=1 Tax=uncultured Armatimonadetes bacterium TaxID=157466 RepID=A0A6J4H1N2_9BACT|nr:PF00070 family, FAD-dependent NAD(P)-disulphide oxidoreductase [uncultured Armatimonadetes bacterium]